MNRRVVASVPDMFFAAKIRGTAEQHGVQIVFARTLDALVAAAQREQTDLVIIDLESTSIDPALLAEALKADEHLRGVELMGFFSHVNVDLRRSALAAGFDQVLPRSAFHARLPQILAGDNS